MDQEPLAVKYASVEHGDSEECMKLLCQLIKDDLKLMKDQIVSISIHDSTVKSGNLAAVVFYKTRTTSSSSEPCENIGYHLIERDEDTDWGDILQETLINNGKNCNLGIGSTFRNVGDEKISCQVYLQGRAGPEICQQVFSRKCEFDELLKEAEQFMNEFITPQEFVGITLFEDEHPLLEREAQTGCRNVIVYHTAGKQLQALKDLKQDIIGPIYSFTKVTLPENKKSWDPLYDKVIERISDLGEVEGHFVATTTASDDNNKGIQMAVHVNYDLVIAGSLKDLRNPGCCTIF